MTITGTCMYNRGILARQQLISVVCGCSFTVSRSGCLNQPPGVGSYTVDVTIAARGGKTEAVGRMDVAVRRDSIDLPGLAECAAVDGASQLCIDFWCYSQQETQPAS